MDPQMVWDAMDECEEECKKSKSASKASVKKEPDPEIETEPEAKAPSGGFFGFPFGGYSKR